MLVKTINQFGRHIPSAGGHRGEAPGPWRPPALFQTVVWAPEDRPGLSGVRRPSRAGVCVRVIIGERESAAPAPAPAA